MFESAGLTRRNVLRGVSLALVGGIPGCSTFAGDDREHTPQSSQSRPPTETSSKTEIRSTVTTRTDTFTMSFPYLHPSTGTTGYGVELQGSPVMGSDDAPIDMYYWTDYMCPWC
jgi:hypothetical protein